MKNRMSTMEDKIATIIFRTPKHKRWAEDILGYKFPGQELKFQTKKEMEYFVELLNSRSFTEQLTNPSHKLNNND